MYNTLGASFSGQLYDSIKRILPYIKRLITVKLIKQDELIALEKLDPKTVAAFFLPGGHAPAYNESLGVAGSSIIQDYVAKGGTFYGICAGAYYSAKSLSWMSDNPDKIIKKNNLTLNFFNGHAHGPQRELIACSQHFNRFNRFAYTDVVPVIVKDMFSLGKANTTYLAHSFYMAGPYFQGDINPDHVMAYYQVNGESKQPCVLNIPYENGNGGRSLLISSHPELSYEDLELFSKYLNGPDAQYIASLMTKLKENHRASERFWCELLSYAIPEVASIPHMREEMGGETPSQYSHKR